MMPSSTAEAIVPRQEEDIGEADDDSIISDTGINHEPLQSQQPDSNTDEPVDIRVPLREGETNDPPANESSPLNEPEGEDSGSCISTGSLEDRPFRFSEVLPSPAVSTSECCDTATVSVGEDPPMIHTLSEPDEEEEDSEVPSENNSEDDVVPPDTTLQQNQDRPNVLVMDAEIQSLDSHQSDNNSLMDIVTDNAGVPYERLRTNEPSWVARVICWSIMLPFAIVLALLFVLFLVIPVLLLAMCATCFYYCCTSDPLAPRLLWSALWQDEYTMPPPTVERVHTPEQLKAACLRRRLTEKRQLDSVDEESEFVVALSREKLVFSAPLPSEMAAVDGNDEQRAPVAASHYYRGNISDVDLELGEKVASDSVPDVADVPAGVAADQGSVHAPSESSETHRWAACDICLLDYEVGDVVAWSHNPTCKHAFHEDCISDWLVRKHSCPSCRREFVRDEDLKEKKGR